MKKIVISSILLFGLSAFANNSNLVTETVEVCRVADKGGDSRTNCYVTEKTYRIETVEICRILGEGGDNRANCYMQTRKVVVSNGNNPKDFGPNR